MNLSSPNNATIADNQGIGTILNDDAANSAPTNIALSNNTIAENAGANAMVGTLSAPPTPTPATRSPTPWSPAPAHRQRRLQHQRHQPARQRLASTSRRSSLLGPRALAPTPAACSSRRPFTITVTNVNEAPTDIALSQRHDRRERRRHARSARCHHRSRRRRHVHLHPRRRHRQHRQRAPSRSAATSCATNARFDFEAKSSYSVRVRGTDAGGLFFEKAVHRSRSPTSTRRRPTSRCRTTRSPRTPAPTPRSARSRRPTPTPVTRSPTPWSPAPARTDNGAFKISGTTLRTNAASTSRPAAPTRSASAHRRRRPVLREGRSRHRHQRQRGADRHRAVEQHDRRERRRQRDGRHARDHRPRRRRHVHLHPGRRAPATDNGRFNISGNHAAGDAIASTSRPTAAYTVRVRTTDAAACSSRRPFTITVTNVNEAPPVADKDDHDG